MTTQLLLSVIFCGSGRSRSTLWEKNCPEKQMMVEIPDPIVGYSIVRAKPVYYCLRGAC